MDKEDSSDPGTKKDENHSLRDKVVRGTMTNTETGRSWTVQHYLLCTGAELTAIVKIDQIGSYTHPNQSMQIVAQCQALDGIGGVYNLTLNFTPDSGERRNQILQDLTTDSILLVMGEYAISRDGSITLYNPSYRKGHPRISEEEVREAFRMNASC